MSRTNDYFMAGLAAIVGTVALIAVPVFLSIQIAKKQCEWDWKNSSFEYKTTVAGTCLINTPAHGWLPAKNFRGMND